MKVSVAKTATATLAILLVAVKEATQGDVGLSRVDIRMHTSPAFA